MVGYSGDGITRRVMLVGALAAGVVTTILHDDAFAGPRAADAKALKPHVHTRARWGARPSTRAARVRAEPPDRIVIHHTSTPNSPDMSLAHAYRLSRDIQRLHMDERGWNDIGEQLTISRGGHVMEGRNRSLEAIMSGRHVVGAQTLGHNSHTIGIENEGTYSTVEVPPRLWASMMSTCAWLCAAYDLDPRRAIVGHRDYGDTDCPGDLLYARLPELRRAVAERLLDPDSAGDSDGATDSIAEGNRAPGRRAGSRTRD